MKTAPNNSIKPYLIPVVAIAIISLVLFALVGFNYDNLSTIITSYGLVGVAVYMIVGVCSVVFAPLSTIPFWPAIYGAYGFIGAVFVTWLSGLIGSILNYYLAAVFGRPIIKRLVGDQALNEIDKIAALVGRKGLIMVRTIGNASFDYASYACGLARFDFKSYLIITAGATLVWNLVTFYLIGKAISLSVIPSIAIMLGMYFTLVLIGVRVWRHYLAQK